MLSVKLNFYWTWNISLIIRMFNIWESTVFGQCQPAPWWSEGNVTPLKRRLDWDFLQAIVKMITAANKMLPGSLPFSSAVLEDRAKAGGNPRQLRFVWPHLILTHLVLWGPLTTRESSLINGVSYWKKSILHLINKAVKSCDMTNIFSVKNNSIQHKYKYICISHLY